MHTQVTQKSLFYRPLFWTVFLLASLAGAIFSYLYLPMALPILDLTITMDRTAALHKSHEIAKRDHLGPQDNYRQAAYFTSGSNLQNYIELEAGGKEAWQKLINSGKYYPYTWCVRHFKESDPHELLIQFSPTGKPYGFDEKISENIPGPQLSTKQAQALAEKVITAWDIDLVAYKIIESSQHKTIANRLDHTFVYERINDQIGDTHYRFTVVVSGDKVTKLHHFMEVPEAFSRRYQAMRTANDLLSDVASALVYILYILLGCVIGLVILLKQRWVLLKPAFKWAVIVALGQALIQINELPLTWCSYNTAESAQGHIIQTLMQALIAFIYYIALYTLTFSAAESLTRKAFGHQIQLWSVWKNPVASSYQILGRTITGYAIISFDFIFIILFYGIGSRLFGWWSPASTFVEPNILGTYVPWIQAIARALGAGFWEECLFRAVPLSLCALIGERYKKRKVALAIGMVLQALIFGSAHANYPAQPWFIRAIELIVPSVVWGFTYIALGLLPVIITHVVFDAILFAMPLFIASGFNKYFVILAILVPILVILYKRIKAGAWHDITQKAHPEYYNQAWQPEQIHTQESETSCPIDPFHIRTYKLFLFGCAGFIASFLWLQIVRVKSDIPAVNITKAQALSYAKQAVPQAILSDNAWESLTQVNQAPAEQHEFIWKKNHDVYPVLLEKYLAIPQWNIRFARFTGDLISRAEEYRVQINNNGHISGITHLLPESAPGVHLSESDARIIAHKHIRDFYKQDPQILEEISAASTNQPKRTDWEFNFHDNKYKLKSGQPRMSVTIAGDTISHSSRYIYVPEDWQRAQQSEGQIAQIIALISTILSFFIIGFALWQSIRTVGSEKFPLYYTIIFGSIIFISSIISTINNWPDIAMSFVTTKSYMTNSFTYLISNILSIIKATAWVGIVAGACYLYKKQCVTNSPRSRIFIGISLGLVYTCVLTFTKNFTQSTLPVYPVLTGINAFIPWLSILIAYFMSYLQQASLITLLLSLVPFKFSSRWIIAALAVAFMISGSYQHISYFNWIAMLAILTCLFIVCINYYLKWDTTVIPIIIAVPYICNLFTQIYYPPYTHSVIGYFCAIILLALWAYTWSKSLEKA